MQRSLSGSENYASVFNEAECNYNIGFFFLIPRIISVKLRYFSRTKYSKLKLQKVDKESLTESSNVCLELTEAIEK
ncbi:MAG: hypothetical protein GYA55_06160 [SAR324 cluster bacterium]|uniref:Uncharacterized protein n=1 Tax=SAR324 cluster bacterium TaxID=2024889 RepID=A0A7X9FR05_9DELT|nr:hypothetical protein [SAR324 cluster bacterium]